MEISLSVESISSIGPREVFGLQDRLVLRFSPAGYPGFLEHSCIKLHRVTYTQHM